MLAEIEVESGGRVENAGAKSKAQLKRERQRRKQKEQAARDEVSAILDQLGLAEHLRLCMDNEMDIGASATLGPWPLPFIGTLVCELFQQISRLMIRCVRRCN